MAEAFLLGFQGILQTDAYAGYNGFSEKKHIIQAGCWAHARRKFMDIVKTTKIPGKAYEAVAIIRQLYAVEKQAREKQLAHKQRRALRQKESKAILEKLKTWLEDTRPCVPTKSPLGKAIAYTLNQWSPLLTYLEHGEVEIDNNLVENAIRPFAVGRRNWLFMGSDRGARAGALFYSLIATCKLHRVEPQSYFNYVLTHLPACKIDKERMQLLPPFVDNMQLIKTYFQPY